jgi:DNA-binding winged helix-turn-helix (wHTH) protein
MQTRRTDKYAGQAERLLGVCGCTLGWLCELRCQPHEFAARVWICAHAPRCARRSVLSAGPIALDPVTRQVHVQGEPVSLTRAEFEILRRLVERRALTHAEILTEVLGCNDRVETSKVRFHVANLRRKLGSASSLIETIAPRSLRLNVDESNDELRSPNSPVEARRLERRFDAQGRLQNAPASLVSSQ